MMRIEFSVKGRPVPKPRMTRADRWKKCPVVERYRAWCDLIVLAARRAGLPTPFTCPVEISFTIRVHGNPASDLDNYIKGVKDALVKGGFLREDRWQYVPRYGASCVNQVTRGIEGAEIVIRELEGKP